MLSIENSKEDLVHGCEFKEIESKVSENLDTSYPILRPMPSLNPPSLSVGLDIISSLDLQVPKPIFVEENSDDATNFFYIEDSFPFYFFYSFSFYFLVFPCVPSSFRHPSPHTHRVVMHLVHILHLIIAYLIFMEMCASAYEKLMRYLNSYLLGKSKLMVRLMTSKKRFMGGNT